MIARWAWAALMLALAPLMMFAQLDRASRFAPEYAQDVPQSLRGFAAERATQLALVEGDFASANDNAQILIAARPLPAQHLTLLAQARLGNGDDAGALAALQLASSRGWREPLSQMAMAGAALEAGEFGIAANRVAALAAIGFSDPQTELVRRALLASPEGREAIAERLAQGGHWDRHFLSSAASHASVFDMADLIMRAQAHGVDVPCPIVRGTAEALRPDHPALVRQMWPAECAD